VDLSEPDRTARDADEATETRQRRLAYDPNIAAGFGAGVRANPDEILTADAFEAGIPPLEIPEGALSAAVDLWFMWRAVQTRNLLIIRGQVSELLPSDVSARMMGEDRPPALTGEAWLVEVRGAGHVPSLYDALTCTTVARFFDRCDS
jgi:hypothetical protein